LWHLILATHRLINLWSTVCILNIAL